MGKITTESYVKQLCLNTHTTEFFCVPPIAEGQLSKNYLIEDLRLFLCTALSADLRKYETSPKPFRNEKIVQELILYYHIIGYTDEAAIEKIISVLDRKEEFDGE